MNLHQRSDQSVPTISGRKISNYFTCTVKQVRKLSPQLYQQTARQKTFQTDSFKQILTKRSGCPSNKENISVQNQNKVLKRIKEEPINKQNQKSQENKKKTKSNQKKVQKKSSAASLIKMYERNKSASDLRKKQVKSISPSRDLKDYRSGPIDKKNHLSNYTSHRGKQKQIPKNKSQKNLVDKSRTIKNVHPSQPPSVINNNTHHLPKRQQKQKQKNFKKQKSKKSKNSSKNITMRKQNINAQRTEALAKQFDLLLKRTKPKQKKQKNKNKSKSKQKSKQFQKKSKDRYEKQKKIVVSHNNSKNYLSKNKINSYYSDQSAQSPQKGILSTRYQPHIHLQNKDKQRQIQKQKQKNVKNKRLSFQPSRSKGGKTQSKAKTQALSPQKDLSNKNQAAIMIQKVFRGYLTRKYISQFKRILYAVITIQRCWRGWKARKQVALLKNQKQLRQKQEQKQNQKQKQKNKKQMKLQNNNTNPKIFQFPQKYFDPNSNNQANQNQLQTLLHQILKQQHINQKIKHRISDFLKKQEKNYHSSKSNSITSHHLQQEIRSEKKFFQEFQRKRNNSCNRGCSSPILRFSPTNSHSHTTNHIHITHSYYPQNTSQHSSHHPQHPTPKLSKSDLQNSPQLIVDNLLTIKQFQKQKLINNARLQLQGIESLSLKKIFSPKTRQFKMNQVQKRLQQELKKFQNSIGEVIKNCRESEEIGEIRPFQSASTPQKNILTVSRQQLINYPQNSPHMSPQPKISYSPQQELQPNNPQSQLRLEPLNPLNNSSQRKLQDLSMQLLQYYQQKTHQKTQRQYEKIDPSYQFIQQYLLSLFQFLRQMGQQYRQSFINVMRLSRNLQIGSFLKNLYVLTQDSDQDVSFKLPMYKYLEQEQVQVLTLDIAEQFNNYYNRLQRHQLGLKVNLEDVYLKMIIDAVNQALNLQRPNHYIFTQTSLFGRSNKMRILQLEALDGLDSDDNQPQFSFYFANSMNHIYKWAHLQCGRTVQTIEQQNQQPIMYTNQNSLKQYLKYQAQKQSYYYDELLEVIVSLSNQIFDMIVCETIEIFL